MSLEAFGINLIIILCFWWLYILNFYITGLEEEIEEQNEDEQDEQNVEEQEQKGEEQHEQEESKKKELEQKEQKRE